MKKLIVVLLGLALTSTIAVTTARGQANGPLWTLDENGPALLNGGPIVGYANGSYKLDPASGITGWYYPLGPSVPGDLLLFENTNTFSDLLRFDGNGVFFFSDREATDLNPDKADVFVMPQPFGSNIVSLLEIGPEGNNGALYFPSPGGPGFDASGALPGLGYNIISDVPEPGSAAFLLGTTAALGFNFIRRRTRS